MSRPSVPVYLGAWDVWGTNRLTAWPVRLITFPVDAVARVEFLGCDANFANDDPLSPEPTGYWWFTDTRGRMSGSLGRLPPTNRIRVGAIELPIAVEEKPLAYGFLWIDSDDLGVSADTQFVRVLGTLWAGLDDPDAIARARAPEPVDPGERF